MLKFAEAKMLGWDDLVRIIKDDEAGKDGNMPVSRMIFADAFNKKKTKRLVFPVFLQCYAPEEWVIVFVVQWMNGMPCMASFRISKEEIGQKIRFWDMPPTKGLMEDVNQAEEALKEAIEKEAATGHEPDVQQ